MLWVGASAGLLAAAALVTLPHLGETWDPRPWFQAAYLTGVVLLDGLIALMLALHVLASSRTLGLAWLAGGYAFSSLTAFAQFLTFPDIRQTSLPDAANAQASAWLWLVWHCGFPCFVLFALRAKVRSADVPPAGASPPRARDLLPIATGVLVGAALGFLLVGFADALPILIVGGNYSIVSQGPLGALPLGLTLLALGATIHVTRLRATLHLWLALALFALTLDAALSLAGTFRYSGGWYVGRMLSLASAGALMVVLLLEHLTLYRDAEFRALFHEQEARRDPLTGLFNRRHLGQEVAKELARARRYRHALSLLLLDVDHFKRINDERGHAMGDECLRAIADALTERVHRPGDCAARYGGEEFVVVLPETGLPAAIDVAEQLRRRIETLHRLRPNLPPLTVSIGVASTGPEPISSLRELVVLADQCLYEAKRQGRNRVAHHQAAAGCVVEARVA